MWPNPDFPEELVIFIEEILNEKRHFLCSDTGSKQQILSLMLIEY